MNNGSPEALFETDEDRNYFLVTFKLHPEFPTEPMSTDKNDVEQGEAVSGLSWDYVGTKLGLSSEQAQTLFHCNKQKGIKELMQLMQRQNRTKFRNRVLNPLISKGLIEMTIPDKPRNRSQKYRLTTQGRKVLKTIQNEK